MTDPLDQAIEASLAERNPQEIAGAYQAICGMMLLNSALAIRRRICARNENALEKNAAKRWVAGSSGVLNFAECCEALDMDAAWTRRALEELGSPISKANPEGHSHA